MCEHEWVTTVAEYRETPYKIREIRRNVCKFCLKTQYEIVIEQQLAAANARIETLKFTDSMAKEEINRLRKVIKGMVINNVGFC